MDQTYLKNRRPTMIFLLIWAALNLFLNADLLAPESHPARLLRLSPDIAVLLAGICLLRWSGRRLHGAAVASMVILLIFLRLFRVGDVLMPVYFNRAFNLYMDSRYLPDLMHLLYNTTTWWGFAGGVVAAFLFLWGLAWLLARALRFIDRYFERPDHRVFFCAVLVLAVGVSAITGTIRFGKGSGALAASVMPRLTEEIRFMLHVNGHRDAHLAAIESAMARSEEAPSDLSRLEGANVFILFVESYGHIVFGDDERFRKLGPVLIDMDQALTSDGFVTASNFIKAPTFAGASWLSHATLATGIYVPSQMKFNLLLHSKATPMAAYFKDAGYRTVSVMPGTTKPWPEGAFFQFEQKYDAHDMGYAGPGFGWCPMPDQFVLKTVYEKEIRNARRPLMMEVILVSTHAPFHSQPVYVEDWDRIGDGRIYHDLPEVRFPVTWPDLTNAHEAYVASLIYEFRVLKEFLIRYLPENSLVVILGDHQPNRHLTGEHASWSVPVHIVTDVPRLAAPFLNRGYRHGMIPDQPGPHDGMATFLPRFLKDFSEPGGVTVSGR